MTTALTHDLSVIQREATDRENENEQFRSFLKHEGKEELDKLVMRLNKDISAGIDCTLCGNCCRSLIVNIEPGEMEKLSTDLGLPLQIVKENYLEESQQGQLVINKMPCHFLENNKCGIYEHRFIQCREFPHLHKPHFIHRLSGIFMYYGTCPIVYNVIEQLKTALSFK